jgi:S1-C subfamily serine protease
VNAISLLAVLLPCLSSHTQEPKSEEIYAKVLPSVMTLKAELGDGKTATGTAFMALREGMAITAWHVVSGAKRVTAKFSSGEEFEVSGIVDQDVKRDVAIIRVKTFGKPLLDLQPADPAVGSKAYVIGAPRGLDFSISDGLVSQIRIVDGMKQIQFSCPASPGNSGGPLLDAKGSVTGVIDWQRGDGQNLNFAVHIGYAMGLDPTLATVPWSDVKVASPTGIASVDAMDRMLTRATMLIEDGLTLSDVLKEQVIRAPNGFKNGVPVEYFNIIRELERAEKDLQEVRSTGEPQETIRRRYAKLTPILLKGLRKLREAISSAQAANGWVLTAGEQAKEAWSFIAEVEGEDGLTEYMEAAFVKKLPIDVRIALGVEKDTSGFVLGVSSWTSAPTSLVLVVKDLFAWKLGFRPGDFVVAVESKPISLMTDLKGAIGSNLGKKLNVTVRRGNVEKALTLKIPKEIPKEFLRN